MPGSSGKHARAERIWQPQRGPGKTRNQAKLVAFPGPGTYYKPVSRPRQLGIVIAALLALSVLPACFAPAAPPSLDGEWKVRVGFSESYLRDVDMDGPEWKTVSLPINNLSATGDENFTGWVTLRRELPVAATNGFWLGQDVGFYSGRLSDVAHLYFNDRRFGEVGSMEPYRSGTNLFFLGRVPPASVSDRNFLTVALHATEEHRLWFGFSGDLMMGRLDAVLFRFYSVQIFNMMLIAVYIAVGVYHLLLFNWHRDELYNLFFGLFCLVVSLFWFNLSGLQFYLYGYAQWFRLKVDLWMLLLLAPLFLFFLSQLLEGKYDPVGYVYGAFCGLLGLAMLFTGYRSDLWILQLWQYSMLPMLIYGATYVLRRYFAGDRDAPYIVASVLGLFCSTFYDILVATDRIPGVQITRYVFFIFITAIAFILANRFRQVHRKVETLNAGLEEKIRDRTRRMESTIDDLRVLKEQQDGDYFLTSLLLRPLSQNRVRSEVVDVRMMTRQATHFQFRRWAAEIGGDLTAAEVLNLRGRRYVALLNGDAMGKSIQGAGGALVLGTAFKSLLERTQTRSELRRLDPELWLKQCFDELQGVFAAFDGTMLVSLVVGLLDEHSGLFYYINAEHPFVVLYRDGKADFIERHVRFRKVGVTGLEGGITIRTTMLLPGDVLFLGSDGRDDLLLGYDEDGQRLINEDEGAFLQRVEEAGGDLEELERSLLRWGELMDDLSLVRVGFKEDVPSPELIVGPEEERLWETARAQIESGELNRAAALLEGLRRKAPEFAAPQKELAKVYTGLDRYDRALRVGRDYSKLAPDDTDWLFELARMAVRIGDDREAARFADRVRLRDPKHVEALTILMEANVRLGRPDRAARLVNRILYVEPKHAGALKLRDTLAPADQESF